jgi:hypothetical protein
VKFRIGNCEFGEIYHMACAYHLDSSVTVEFINFAEGEEFFDAFVVHEPRHRQGKHERPGKSANVIRDHYYDGCMQSVCDKIYEKARDDEWQMPPVIQALLTNDPKVLLWHRTRGYQPHRNSSIELIQQLAGLCHNHNTIPILIGNSAVQDSNCNELMSYWEDEFFTSQSVGKQLWCLDALFRHGRTLASVGVMSGAMDGPALFFGHKTIFLARHRDATPRMQKVSSGVPNLLWQQVEYGNSLSRLTDADLAAIERKIWC